MKKPSNDIENRLLPKYISGDITESERFIVDEWIAEDLENKKIFEEYKKIWERAEYSIANELNLPVIDIEEEWDHHVGLLKQSKRGFYISTKSETSPWYRIAASISFLLIASFAIYYYAGGFGKSYQAIAENEEISFKDGTIVTLQEGSEISYKRSYNKSERLVEFEGEAYFEVSPDAEKPFIIEISGAKIQVVGTAFNVRALPDENIVEVTVTSGQVMLLNELGNHAVALKVNDKGTLNRKTGEIAKKDNDNINFLAWKTQVLKFESTSLNDVVLALNRAYPDKNIVLKSTNADNCSLTVTFEEQTIESIMKVLESTLDIIYQSNGNSIEIIEAGC